MSRTFTPYTGVGGKRTQEREGLNRLDDQHELASPDLMWAEIGNVLWRKSRAGLSF